MADSDHATDADPPTAPAGTVGRRESVTVRLPVDPDQQIADGPSTVSVSDRNGADLKALRDAGGYASYNALIRDLIAAYTATQR